MIPRDLRERHALMNDTDDQWAEAIDKYEVRHDEKPLRERRMMNLQEVDDYVIDLISRLRGVVEDAGEMNVRVSVTVQAPIQGSTFDGLASFADKVNTLGTSGFGGPPFRAAEFGEATGQQGSVTLYEADKR